MPLSPTYAKTFKIPAHAIDENGHVNNVAYVHWMQEIAVEHYESIGGTNLMQLLGVTWVENVRRVRSLRKYEFVRKSDGEVLLRGETDWASADVKTGAPGAIPEEVSRVFAMKQAKQKRAPAGARFCTLDSYCTLNVCSPTFTSFI